MPHNEAAIAAPVDQVPKEEVESPVRPDEEEVKVEQKPSAAPAS